MVQKNEILDNDSGFTNGNWCLTAQHVGEYLSWGCKTQWVKGEKPSDTTICPELFGRNHNGLSGWWYTYPCEKYQ
jgi:hypothetical protein